MKWCLSRRYTLTVFLDGAVSAAAVQIKYLFATVVVHLTLCEASSLRWEDRIRLALSLDFKDEVWTIYNGSYGNSETG